MWQGDWCWRTERHLKLTSTVGCEGGWTDAVFVVAENCSCLLSISVAHPQFANLLNLIGIVRLPFLKRLRLVRVVEVGGAVVGLQDG